MTDQPAPPPPPPTLDPKHDADLIAARQAMLDAQASARAAQDAAAAAEEAYTALWATKLNHPETGWRPRIWALDKSDAAKGKRLKELELLPGVK